MPAERRAPVGETMSDEVPPRGVWGSLLVLGLLWLGLVGGTSVGATWFVPEGSGLAGPAMAFGYGLATAAAGVVVGVLIAWRARPETVRAVTRPVLVLSLFAVVILGWLIAHLDTGSAAGATSLSARPTPPK